MFIRVYRGCLDEIILTHNQLVPGSSPGGTTNKKPQPVDLQLVEVLFLYNTPFGVLYRVLKFRNFSYIRKS